MSEINCLMGFTFHSTIRFSRGFVSVSALGKFLYDETIKKLDFRKNLFFKVIKYSLEKDRRSS